MEGQSFISSLSPCEFWDKVHSNRNRFDDNSNVMNTNGFPPITISEDKLLDFLEFVLNDWKSEYPGSISREQIRNVYLNKLI